MGLFFFGIDAFGFLILARACPYCTIFVGGKEKSSVQKRAKSTINQIDCKY